MTWHATTWHDMTVHYMSCHYITYIWHPKMVSAHTTNAERSQQHAEFRAVNMQRLQRAKHYWIERKSIPIQIWLGWITHHPQVQINQDERIILPFRCWERRYHMAPEFLEPSKVYRNKVPHLAASSKTLGVHAQKVKIQKHFIVEIPYGYDQFRCRMVQARIYTQMFYHSFGLHQAGYTVPTLLGLTHRCQWLRWLRSRWSGYIPSAEFQPGKE